MATGTNERATKPARRIPPEAYEALMEDVPVAVCRLAPTGRILEANDVFYDRLQLTRKDTIGAEFSRLVPESERASVRETFASLSIEDPTASVEHPLVAADGSLCECQWTYRILLDGAGETAGFQCVGADSTASLSEAGEQARQVREKYSSIVENVGIGIALISPDMRILELNRQMREWFPEVDPAKGPICYRVYNNPPRQKPCSYCPTVLTLADGEAHESITETPTPEGVRNYRIVSSPVRDAGGEVVAAIEMVDDVTERRRAQEALRESRRKFKMLADLLPETVFEADVQCNLTYVNLRAYQMFGHSEADFAAGLNGLDLIAPQDREEARRNIGRVLAGEEVGGAEYLVQRKDGTVFDAMIHSVPILRDGRPEGLRGIIVDISDRKRSEERAQNAARRLAALNAELERSNRELQEFTYTVSHDLQEPLRKISAFGQFLKEDCRDSLTDEGQEYVDRMQNAALRMKGLIEHLLKLARVGSRGADPEPTDSGRVARAAADTLSEAANSCDGRIEIADGLPMVLADPVQLEQVFQNLLGNALKFRSPKRSPRVEVDATVRDGQVEFTVTDNGVGIDPAYSEKIFGVFRRLHPERDCDGAGIGLSLCKKIVERHGGRIRVESKPGRGSTFRFTMPSAGGSDEADEG